MKRVIKVEKFSSYKGRKVLLAIGGKLIFTLQRNNLLGNIVFRSYLWRKKAHSVWFEFQITVDDV